MIKPMLAHKYNADKAKFPAYIQPKLDGVRCIIKYENGFNPNLDPLYDDRDKIVAYSRTGKEFKNIDHIKKSLKSFFDEFPKAVLDGELYNHELKDDFEKIISLVRRTKPTKECKLESKKLIGFHCYDVIAPPVYGPNWPYSRRKDFLIEFVPQNKCIHLVPTAYILNDRDAGLHHKANLKAGYEGSILRSLDGEYKHTRSWDLMKFKDFEDSEALIVGYELGKGKRKGTLGKFIMEDSEGIQFGCPPGKGYDYKEMTYMLNNISDYIGKMATFTFFGRTKANSYRHPLFKALRNYE